VISRLCGTADEFTGWLHCCAAVGLSLMSAFSALELLIITVPFLAEVDSEPTASECLLHGMLKAENCFCTSIPSWHV
jgi:hypothetical protein